MKVDIIERVLRRKYEENGFNSFYITFNESGNCYIIDKVHTKYRGPRGGIHTRSHIEVRGENGQKWYYKSLETLAKAIAAGFIK